MVSRLERLEIVEDAIALAEFNLSMTQYIDDYRRVEHERKAIGDRLAALRAQRDALRAHDLFGSLEPWERDARMDQS